MKMRHHAARVVAFVALAAAAIFNTARGNHYILPCGPDCRDVGEVAIDPGFTGTWIDDSGSGQRISIEVLPGQPTQMLALWFTFAPQGGQAWIIGLGPISGTRAVLEASRSGGSGAQFPPNFDPANVHQEAWGTLTFTFSDCEHGLIEWTATAPGFGSGAMDLVRLTAPAGLTCRAAGGGTAEDADRQP